MDMKVLQEANRLKTLIETEERNIKNWEELFEASEITFSSATKPQKMYLTGSKKEEVKEVIISENKEKLANYKKSFENL